MFNIEGGNLTKNREGYLFAYAQIVFNQLRRYANLEHFEKQVQGWRKYTATFEIEAELLECRIMGVLSAALFLEAYIFDYCARKESASFVDKYIDKLDPVAKWVIATKLIIPPGLDQSDEIFERMKNLFKLRNSLVHHKTKGAENFCEIPEFPKEFNPDRCLKIIQDLLLKLKAIDPTEEFADFVNRHIDSWFKYSAKDSDFYPILWDA